MIILNIPQAAAFIGKTPAALRNGYKRWHIPHFLLGGQIKFTQESLEEWIAKRMTTTPEPHPLSPNDKRRKSNRRSS